MARITWITTSSKAAERVQQFIRKAIHFQWDKDHSHREVSGNTFEKYANQLLTLFSVLANMIQCQHNWARIMNAFRLNLVRAYRNQQGLSLFDLGQAVGIGRTEMLDIESGRRRADSTLLVRIADVLNIPVAEIAER